MKVTSFFQVFLSFIIVGSGISVGEKCQSQIRTEAYTQIKDEFGKDVQWLNLEYQLSIGSFKDKVLIVHTMDLDCIECIDQNLYLSDLVDSTFHIQLITLFQTDSTDVYQKDRILQYIRKNRINHPVGIMPGFNGLRNLKVKKPGVILSYFNQIVPFNINEVRGLSAESKALLQTISAMSASPEARNAFSTSMQLPTYNPDYFAQPLIEQPTYLSKGAGGQQFFVTDAAHDRVLLVDLYGAVNNVIGVAGGGYVEGSWDVARFNGVSGIAFDEASYKLYIADTYNHRLRVADFKNGMVYTVLGNGSSFHSNYPVGSDLNSIITTSITDETESFGYPTDVVKIKNKIYIASGEFNQIFEFNPTGNSAKEVARIENYSVDADKKSYIINLSVTDNELICILTDGRAFSIALNEKGEIAASEFKQICKKDGLTSLIKVDDVYYGTSDHQIMKFEDGAFTTLSGSGQMGMKLGKGSKSMFAFPFDLIEWQDQLLVSDMSNNSLRLTSFKKGKNKTFHYAPSSDLWRFADATSHCESMSFEPVHAGLGSRLTINLDLGKFEIIPAGHNEVHSDGSCPISIQSLDILEDSFYFDITADQYSGAIFLELFLTVQEKGVKDVYYHKRAFLNIPVEYDAQGAENSELVFKPIITE